MSRLHRLATREAHKGYHDADFATRRQAFLYSRREVIQCSTELRLINSRRTRKHWWRSIHRKGRS